MEQISPYYLLLCPGGILAATFWLVSGLVLQVLLEVFMGKTMFAKYGMITLLLVSCAIGAIFIWPFKLYSIGILFPFVQIGLFLIQRRGATQNKAGKA